jgi:L-2,4-diaminobutyrate decarboxylase
MIQNTEAQSETDYLQEANNAFKKYFLNNTSESLTEYKNIVSAVADSISGQIKTQKQAYNGVSPEELKDSIAEIDLFPTNGSSLKDVLDRTKRLVIESNISVYHPNCLAHLHCPTFIASLAAEMIISAFNQSMDSWDQAPAATMIEQALCDRLCAFYGFDSNADATFTSGGTMSNFMGMLLARDRFSQQHLGWNIQEHGLPAEAPRFRIICSEHAHFSVSQSASLLGLGQSAVVKIKQKAFDEEVDALETTIVQLLENGLLPIAYVTTAGTTDFGTIGNIGELAECASKYCLWTHVDAAYGGALMFSEKHKHKLKGIEKADSVTIDFHKLFYQPISCGVFMVKDKASFNHIRLHADYLNPESNEDLGILDLVYKSIQTTRRFDALKPFLALQHIGVKKFGEMLDYTIELAEAVSGLIVSNKRFELAYKTPINAVVFRYLPEELLLDSEVDTINNTIKTNLLLSGKAIIGQTSVRGRAFLKFTLLNPMTSLQDVSSLLNQIIILGSELEKQLCNDLAETL